MADLEAIRQAIIARMQEIPDIGRVHGHQPWLRQERELKALYVEEELLCGWHVRRVATHESAPAVGRWVETHLWRIWGVMAMGEGGESERLFDGLIEAIRDRFREDQDLGGVVASTVTGESAGIQVEQAEPVMFCGVLCHSVQLLLHTVVYQ
ncbi:MAG: hypothetical protein HQM01_11940 [Magnetococcales bacterium]|nr:hypothetical protein [Magnetococcales bacterium]